MINSFNQFLKRHLTTLLILIVGASHALNSAARGSGEGFVKLTPPDPAQLRRLWLVCFAR